MSEREDTSELRDIHRQTAAPVDRDRLTRLLGGPDLAWLVDRVRRRMARGEPLTGPVALTAPTAGQRTAAERLLGRAPGAGRALSVRLDAVDAVLRRSGVSPDGLATAVTALTGPVDRLADVREREERAWLDAYAPLDELIHTRRPELADWAERLRADGLVRRIARTSRAARSLLGDPAEALRRLPAEPAVSLPAFAAGTFGDAHALDLGTPLATLVLAGARTLTGFPDGSGAEWRREAWAAAGLLKDALSSTVLALGLRGTPALDLSADEGEPAVLTLRHLTRRPPPSTCARTRPSWPLRPRPWAPPARSWSASRVSPRPPPSPCCATCTHTAPRCATTATSIGAACASPPSCCAADHRRAGPGPVRGPDRTRRAHRGRGGTRRPAGRPRPVSGGTAP